MNKHALAEDIHTLLGYNARLPIIRSDLTCELCVVMGLVHSTLVYGCMWIWSLTEVFYHRARRLVLEYDTCFEGVHEQH